MVDNVVYIIGLELIQNGNGDSAVGYNSKETDRPAGRVSAHQCNFIAFANIGLLKDNMQFSDFFCQVSVMKGFTFVVSQSGSLPVGFDTVFNKC